MKCVICEKGETRRGKTTITLERDGATLIVKGVPAETCANCGEEYMDERITKQFLKKAEKAVKDGVQIDIREYIAA
jgi:YgiT-type zinc finger domain-containing protein